MNTRLGPADSMSTPPEKAEGDNDKAGQDRCGGVEGGDHDRVAFQVVLFRDVGAQGYVQPPADADGEEYLCCGLGEGSEAEFAEVRQQIILHAGDGVFIYGQCPYAADDQQGETVQAS